MDEEQLEFEENSTLEEIFSLPDGTQTQQLPMTPQESQKRSQIPWNRKRLEKLVALVFKHYIRPTSSRKEKHWKKSGLMLVEI